MNASKIRATAAALVAAISWSAHAVVLQGPWDLFVTSSSVHNDRIGNSRFFGGPNTDRIRISTFVVPSLDSDWFIAINSTGQEVQSTNGGATSVSITHPSMGTLGNPRPLTWVGLRSGRGGGRNEFTTSLDRAGPDVAALLDAWAATPFTATAVNPLAPNAKSISYTLPNFVKDAMPPFVTDLTVTGGTTPTLNWKVPATGSTPNAASLQIRQVNGESADGSRITDAVLVHAVSLPATATTYTVTTLSNAALLGLPSGLQANRKYEVSVQLDVFVGGALKGRSRTFFEYRPLSDVASNVSVYLPSISGSGAFKFDVTVDANTAYPIDPEIAVGYIYETGAGDPNFRTVSLPNVGDGRYTIDVFDPSLGAYRPGFAAAANTSYDFTALGWPQGVAKFRVKGIEASAQLDTTDTTAFVTTVGFTGSGRFTGTMTPIGGYLPSYFASPVNLPPTVTTTRAGATLPLKWSISDKQGFAVSDLGAIGGISYKATSCSAFTSDTSGAIGASAAGGSRLRYDFTAAQYVFNWKTPDAPGCYSLYVTLDTGQVQQAHVMLTP